MTPLLMLLATPASADAISDRFFSLTYPIVLIEYFFVD
jgi:hypothetical protein